MRDFISDFIYDFVSDVINGHLFFVIDDFICDFVNDFINGQSGLRLWRCNVGRLCWRWCFVRELVCGGRLGFIMTGAGHEERMSRTRHYKVQILAGEQPAVQTEHFEYIFERLVP